MSGVRKVWKFPLTPGTIAITMPYDAELLHVDLDPSGEPCVWARVDPHAVKVERPLRIVGTGHVGADGKYVGTFHLRDAGLVFHLFDLSGEA